MFDNVVDVGGRGDVNDATIDATLVDEGVVVVVIGVVVDVPENDDDAGEIAPPPAAAAGKARLNGAGCTPPKNWPPEIPPTTCTCCSWPEGVMI